MPGHFRCTSYLRLEFYILFEDLYVIECLFNGHFGTSQFDVIYKGCFLKVVQFCWTKKLSFIETLNALSFLYWRVL